MDMYEYLSDSFVVVDKSGFSVDILNPNYCLILEKPIDSEVFPLLRYREVVGLWDFIMFDRGDKFSTFIACPNKLFSDIFGIELTESFTTMMIYKKD